MTALTGFYVAVTQHGRARCFGCQVWPGDKGACESRSAGILDAHHLVAKQTLKREFRDGFAGRSLDELIGDPRNGVPLGRWHHDQVENRRRHIPRGLLPPGAEVFAAELGLGWLLDRTYGERTAAA